MQVPGDDRAQAIQRFVFRTIAVILALAVITPVAVAAFTGEGGWLNLTTALAIPFGAPAFALWLRTRRTERKVQDGGRSRDA